MRTINKRIFAAALLVVFSAVNAVPAVSATWQETSALAEKNNNELKAAEKDLESAEWHHKRALTSFLPQISASAGYGRTEPGSTASSSYGLSATQNIFSGFGNINAAKKAYAQMEYSRAGLMQKKAEVLYSARAAYIDLMIAGTDLALQEKILARRQENSKLINLLYENGKEDKGNMMLTLADVESSKASVAQAKRALELARLKLSQIAGADIKDADIPKTEGMAGLPDIEQLVLSSPSYMAARSNLETASIAADEAVAGLLPDISATASLRSSGTAWPPDTDSRTWSVGISYSIFPGGRNIIDKIVKDIEKEKALQNFEQAKKDLLYSVRSAYDSLAARTETLRVKELYLEAATERARIARTKYINGLMSYDEWDRTENSYISSERDFLSSRRESLIAEAAFKKSYGGWIK